MTDPPTILISSRELQEATNFLETTGYALGPAQTALINTKTGCSVVDSSFGFFGLRRLYPTQPFRTLPQPQEIITAFIISLMTNSPGEEIGFLHASCWKQSPAREYCFKCYGAFILKSWFNLPINLRYGRVVGKVSPNGLIVSYLTTPFTSAGQLIDFPYDY